MVFCAEKKDVRKSIRSNFDREEIPMSVLREGQTGSGRQAYSLPVDRIWPNPRQPRKDFDEYALMELASSIRQHGLLQPITVREMGNSGYELVMGERRL